MKSIISVLFVYACLGLLSCQSSSSSQEKEEKSSIPTLQPLAYALTKPVKESSLPDNLKEISGITYVKDGQLACINDEEGDLFLFDYKQGKITDYRMWGAKGDYEDLVFHEGKFYVLRSDGQLFMFTLDQTYQPGSVMSNQSKDIRTLNLELPGKNDLEGLCFDPKTGWFFVAAKETKNDEKKNTRYVYFYDQQRNASWKGIVLREKNFEEVGFSGKDAEFKPSAIATHPITKEVYILASAGKKLLVLDRKGGNFVSVEKLDPEIFEQPEGLCFAPDGTLFISSEGKKGPGKIFQFAYTKAE